MSDTEESASEHRWRIIAQLQDAVDRHERLIAAIDANQDEHGRVITILKEKQDGNEKLSELALRHLSRLSERIDAMREQLAEHEEKEEDKWRRDVQYQQAREDAERRQRKSDMTALMGIMTTFVAVILTWLLSKV